MKIRVLGCSGAELSGHSLSSFLLGDDIVFDAGGLTNALGEHDQQRIRHILVTHAHLDHVKGIMFLADNLAVRPRGHAVQVMGIAPVMRAIKRHLFNGSVWPDFTAIPDPDHAVMNLVSLQAERSIRIHAYTITPFGVAHLVPAVGYLCEDSHARRFFYTGDTGPTDITWKRIGDQRIHALIIEVSFPERLREMALMTGHLTPRLLQQELLKLCHPPERIYITHLKSQYASIITAELERLRIDNLSLLKDGETITV